MTDVAVPVPRPFGVRRSIFDPPNIGTAEAAIVWPLLFIGADLVRFRISRHPVFRKLTLRIVRGGTA